MLPAGSQVVSVPLPDVTEAASLELAQVPIDVVDDGVRECLLAWGSDATDSPPVVLELYGTLIVWRTGRAGVAAPADRLPTAVAAVREFAATVTELQGIETVIAAAWAEYEADLPCGFTLTEADRGRASDLAARYRRAMSLAGRLARLSPRIHQPLHHPPTLAGQIGERLRDRCRLADREEFASDQLEPIIQLYEACGQRVSEHTIAHREYVLIWAIVLLLAAETVMLLVDLLASTAG